MFDGVVTAFNEGSADFAFPSQIKPWPTGTNPTGTVLGANRIVGINTFNGYASNASLIGTSIGAFKAKSLTDPTIFDFYNNLLSGPNQSQFNKFHAINVALSQTFLNEKVGFELAYDKQYDKNGQTSFISNDATSITIDVMKTLIDGSPNPNFGRPVVYAGGGSAGFAWTESKRDTKRATVFGRLDFADISGKDSFMNKIFGRNDFTALYTDQKHDFFNASGNRYYLADSFIPEAGQGSVGQATRDDIFAIYLGAPIGTANGAHDANLSGLKTTIVVPTLQTINYFNNSLNVWQNIPMQLVNNDLSSDRNKTYRGGRKNNDDVKSTAAVWQGYWLDGVIVPMFGYRTDKETNADAGTAPSVPAECPR